MASKALQAEVNKLLSLIDDKAVVTLDSKNGAVYIGGERADQGRLAALKSEAEFFLQSDLWKIINESIKELAQRAMFVNGESLDDLKKGRSMLYLLDTQNRIVKTFKGFIHKPVPKTPTG